MYTGYGPARSLYVILDGTIIGVMGTYGDITEQKKAEMDLQKSFSIIRATLDSSDEGILVADLTRTISEYNNRFIDMWDVPVSIIESRSEKDLQKHAEPMLREPEVFAEFIEDCYLDLELDCHRIFEFKDGRILEIYAAPQRIGEEIVGRFWSCKDITERKKAEEDLRTSKLKMIAGMDLAHLAYWEFDMSGETFHFNDRFYAMYGTTAEKEGGNQMGYETYMSRFVHPEDREAMMRQVWKNRESGYPMGHAQYAHRIIRGDEANPSYYRAYRGYKGCIGACHTSLWCQPRCDRAEDGRGISHKNEREA